MGSTAHRVRRSRHRGLLGLVSLGDRVFIDTASKSLAGISASLSLASVTFVADTRKADEADVVSGGCMLCFYELVLLPRPEALSSYCG